MPCRAHLVCAWLQEGKVKSQHPRSRREEREGRKRKCIESGSGEARARVAGKWGSWAQHYFCTIIQGKRDKLTGQ